MALSGYGTNNHTLRVTAEVRRWSLRISQNLTSAQVQAEHRLLAQLAQAGLPFAVPAPVALPDGSTVVDTAGGPATLRWPQRGRPRRPRRGLPTTRNPAHLPPGTPESPRTGTTCRGLTWGFSLCPEGDLNPRWGMTRQRPHAPSSRPRAELLARRLDLPRHAGGVLADDPSPLSSCRSSPYCLGHRNSRAN